MKYPEKYRIAGSPQDDGGAFRMFYNGRELRIIASHGGGWNHVSVSMETRCPTWKEMCYVKDAFFEPEDCVIQYHPPKSKYKNLAPYCLHLWQPQEFDIPLPPSEFV
jgi:hypothetical protein